VPAHARRPERSRATPHRRDPARRDRLVTEAHRPTNRVRSWLASLSRSNLITQGKPPALLLANLKVSNHLGQVVMVLRCVGISISPDHGYNFILVHRFHSPEVVPLAYRSPETDSLHSRILLE